MRSRACEARMYAVATRSHFGCFLSASMRSDDGSATNTVDLARRLPNSQLVVYPDAGHGGVFQFNEDFVKRALEFL
jgi:pimeloyl-ACP methyl ester carboxylesterase